MTDIVRRAEYIGQANIIAIIVLEHFSTGIPNLMRLIISIFISLESIEIRIIHHVGSCSIRNTVHLTSNTVDVSVRNKVLTVSCRHLVPVPPADDIVQLVGVTLVVHRHLIYRLAVGIVPRTNLHRSITIVGTRHLVGIEVRLHIQQLQLSVRCGSNGQWQMHLLRIGISRTSVGRHLLLVDIHITLHIPVVGLRVISRTDDISIVRGVTVIDDTFLVVDEVT